LGTCELEWDCYKGKSLTKGNEWVRMREERREDIIYGITRIAEFAQDLSGGSSEEEET
jgi:hypothetical protein